MDIYNLLNALHKEIDRIITMSSKMDKKLQETLPEKDYIEFSKSLAADMYEDWIENLPDGDFKEFVRDNKEDFMNDDLWEDEENG